MLDWLSSRRRGQRISDRRAPRIPTARRDRALIKAIAENAIDIHFQPQFDVLTGKVVAAEALARWDGAVSPEALFRRAAVARLSERLSRSVQSKALQAAAGWSGALADLRLSVNLLADDLARPGYEGWLLREMERWGLPPERVTVEITEGSLVADMPGAADRLSGLRAAGVKIAVDDFGTGYASLGYLTALPLDTLKIDRGLIADLVGGTRDRIVVKALLALARELELQVVVEGVETPDQLALLADWGCDLYQGFLGAGALDEAALAALVSVRNGKSGCAAAPATARA